jgi:uncharacterized membrane protein YadS
MSTNRRWTSGMFATEDWWSVWIGLALFGAGLLSLVGLDLVGWMARPRPWEWTDLIGAFAWSKLFAAAGATYAAWHPLASWLVSYAVFTALFAMGAQTIQASAFALDLILAGAAATFVAYLFFWPIVYTAARRLFGFPRDVAAVLASGISVCGVSAAIATAGAIRAKPVIPVAISMVVVIFAMLELIVLPGAYTALFPDQPVVNGAALGMTVKTDGADAAAGALLDELMIARNLQLTGVHWQAGWILSAAILTKIWIDVFIGVWAFVLAIVWIRKVEPRGGAVSISPMEIWFRFPKFVLGYFVAWLGYLAIAAAWPALKPALAAGTSVVQGPMRTLLFMLTFVAMGAITDFATLKGMGKVALLYGLALVVVIVPIAYAVAYLFHRGLAPPLVQ